MLGNSPTVTIRVPALLLAAIDQAVTDLNALRNTSKCTRSTIMLMGASMALDKIHAELAHLMTPIPIEKKTAKKTAKRKSK